MVAASAFIAGCAAGPQEPDQPKPTVTTTIYGQVVDEAGQVVSGASVSSGLQTVITDDNGLFILRNVVVPETRLVVTAKKAGYFTAARAETPQANGATRTKLFMMSNAVTTSIPSSTGGTVTVSGGASVQFAGGSFVTSSGAAYSGTVNVAARYLDPASRSFGDYFAGDNLAQTASGDEANLISCGVLRIEITAQNGDALKLDPTKPATLSYPKPSSNPNAPTTMPLWYFDESLGMWKEDGSATLQGGKYIGTVTHFTDWNLDYGGDCGILEFRVVCDDIGLGGVAVKIGGFDHKTGYTSPDGSIRFVRVPADKEIEIFIRAEDNDGMFWMNTPVKANLIANQVNNIGDVKLNSPCPGILFGTLNDCGDVATDGLLLATWAGGASYTYTKTEGKFSLLVASGADITLIATRADGNEGFPTPVLALAESEKRDIGPFKVCGDGIPTFFDIPIDVKQQSMITLSDDGSKVALYTWYGAPTVDIYDVKSGAKLVSVPTTQQMTVNDVQFSPDATKIFVRAGLKFTMYDLVSGAELWTLQSVAAGFFTENSNQVLLHIGNFLAIPKFQIHDATTGALVFDVTPPSVVKYTTLVGAYGNTQFLYCDPASVNDVIVWDFTNGSEVKRIPAGPTKHWIRGISMDGTLYGGLTNTSELVLYDITAGQKLSQFQIMKGSLYRADTGASRLRSLTKHYFADRLSDSTGGGGIRILNTADGTLKGLKSIQGTPGTTQPIYDAVFSADEQWLAALVTDRIRVWQIK